MLDRLRSALRRDEAAEPERGFPSAWDDWHRRKDAARDCFVPWVEAVMPLAGKTVLEYGSGGGAVTAAFAPGTERYIGLDIDEDAIRTAEGILAEGGIQPELIVAPPDRVLEETAKFRGEIDVFLCYAVLEHMSIDERQALLRLARDVVRPDGIIVVIETPNRLTPWDYHTSQLPFLNQLPQDVAIAYAERSQREDFAEAMRVARAQGPEALEDTFIRWGRGMSYHELELVFDDLPAHIVASSWEPVLLPERAVYREELALDRILASARPDLPPAFSRYWLDFILTPVPRPGPRAYMRPWPLRTSGSAGVAYTANEVLWVEGPDARLAVDLPAPSTRLVVGIEGAGEAELVVRARRPDGGEEVTAPARPSTPGTAHAELTLPTPAQDVERYLSRAGTVSFVLYGA
jgi:2-polyprenyl-3-methyl-5-hydroxy-6-metoxy-1,4-benzoquinol methylase